MKGSTIVVATDLSETAACAAQWAVSVADRVGASLVVAHVVQLNVSNWAAGNYEIFDNPTTHDKAVARVADWFEEATGRPPAEVAIDIGDPREKLSAICEAHDAAMLTVAMSGKGAWKRVLVGSTAQSLAAQPPCPLAIVHPEHVRLHDPPRLIVGVDFTAQAEHALAYAGRLAAATSGHLDIVHANTAPVVDVVDAEDMPEDVGGLGSYDWAADELIRLVDAHQTELAEVNHDSHIIEDYPPNALVDFVDEHEGDAIIVSRTGTSRLVATLIGSVLQRLIQAMPTTLIIVPTPQTDED